MADDAPCTPSQKPSFLEDNHGNPSTMRLMSVFALAASIAFGAITIMRPNINDGDGLYITTAFLLAAFFPKALQKFAEVKFPPPKP